MFHPQFFCSNKYILCNFIKKEAIDLVDFNTAD